jgi:hypothetical protein
MDHLRRRLALIAQAVALRLGGRTLGLVLRLQKLEQLLAGTAA